MTSIEVHESKLSFFGRIADDLTRRVLGPAEITVSLEGHSKQVIKKHDGYFAFAGLAPSTADYRVRVTAQRYQGRTIARSLAGKSSPVELSLAGEDEVYVSITAISPAQKRVDFIKRSFVPPIDKGAVVIGEGAFVGALDEPLEGHKADFAKLTTVDGLAPGQALRIVRSRNLLVRPGPYYAFPAGTTVAAFKMVEAGPAETPVSGAVIEITEIDAAAARAVDVQGLGLAVFGPVGNPQTTLALDVDDRRTVTNDQGDAVLYFSGAKPARTMKVVVSKTGYENAERTIDLSGGGRAFQKVQLTRQ